jgi:hypothetical protein
MDGEGAELGEDDEPEDEAEGADREAPQEEPAAAQAKEARLAEIGNDEAGFASALVLDGRRGGARGRLGQGGRRPRQARGISAPGPRHKPGAGNTTR